MDPPPPVAGGHRHRAMMTLRRRADSLSTRWLLPLQYQTVVEECMGVGGGQRVIGGKMLTQPCSTLFLIQLCDGCNFLFFFIFLYLLNWKLAVEDIASVIISEWRRMFLWTKQYIKVMHHRWINSCQWTLHSKSMLRFFCLFLCPSFVLSHRSGG